MARISASNIFLNKYVGNKIPFDGLLERNFTMHNFGKPIMKGTHPIQNLMNKNKVKKYKISQIHHAWLT